MKPIKVDLQNFNEIELHVFSDLHIGDMACNYRLIQDRIKRVQETPNAVCILNGDLMDTAIASSIGDTYASTHNPMEQLQECVNLFAPIKDKIIAVLSGNHENRIYKYDGLDTTHLMCAQLGIADRYSPTAALVFLRFGEDNKHRKILYTIYAVHGSGGGRKAGGKVNRLTDLSGIVDADIYIHGHTHLPLITKTAYFRTDVQNSSVQKVDKLFVNTSAMLEYGGYGERQSYTPASLACPVIYLDGHHKKATAVL